MGRKSREKRERRARRVRFLDEHGSIWTPITIAADVKIIPGSVSLGTDAVDRLDPQTVQDVYDRLMGASADSLIVDEYGNQHRPTLPATYPKSWEEQKVGRGQSAQAQRVEKLRRCGFVELSFGDEADKLAAAGCRIIRPITNHQGFVHEDDLHIVETVRAILRPDEPTLTTTATPPPFHVDYQVRTINEIREEHNLPPISSGDVLVTMLK